MPLIAHNGTSDDGGQASQGSATYFPCTKRAMASAFAVAVGALSWQHLLPAASNVTVGGSSSSVPRNCSNGSCRGSQPLWDKFNWPVLEREVWAGQMEEDATGERQAIGHLHLVDQSIHPLAACLDGSPPGFYLRSAPQNSPNRTKWFLYFQGGGHCNFWRSTDSLFNCHGRRDSGAGSTLYDAESRDFSYKEVFSRDPSVTLTWHDWNMVFMRYCDGHSWVSSVTEPYVDSGKPPLYFRGVHNVEAMLRTLQDAHGMRDATDVIAYGCSSGAIGVAANADLMHSLMPKTTFFTAITDSALYPDFSPPDRPEGDPKIFVPAEWAATPLPQTVEKNFFRQGILSMLMPDSYEAAKAFRVSPIWRSNVSHLAVQDQSCIDAFTEQYGSLRTALYLCGIVHYVTPHVAAPLFLINSKYDVYAMKKGLVEPSSDEAFAKASIDADLYGQQFIGTVKRLVEQKRNYTPSAPFGMLIDSCLHHCEWWGDIRFSDDLTNAEEFARWYTATRHWWEANRPDSPGPQVLHIQDEPFPCRDCCLTHWNSSLAQWRRIHGVREGSR
mmetsp:Transcript_20732/g.48164  ORF Transcript_20732/g.48164 Transcript_20732/m.48164 type:complete len:555 (+) Transcript_20732:62-1726(+)